MTSGTAILQLVHRLPLYLARALRLRCPACGAGRVMRSWLSPRERCDRCGQPFERSEEGYFIGSLMVNLIIAELLPAALALVLLVTTWPHPPWNLLLYGGSALAIALPFACYPLSKSLWLALDLYWQPAAPEGMARPPSDAGATGS